MRGLILGTKQFELWSHAPPSTLLPRYRTPIQAMGHPQKRGSPIPLNPCSISDPEELDPCWNERIFDAYRP